MKQYSRTGSLIPGRSVFVLNYEKKFNCDMGQLIPVMCDEVVPGDFFKIGNQAVIRFQPLVAPILHEINMYVHYFFVPYRLLWDNAGTDNWETFITGGVTGNDTPTIPTWAPTSYAAGSLWDFLGFPPGIDPSNARPVDFPRRAYNFIFNSFYRDETLVAEKALTNEAILNRSWEKDYFTSSLNSQQRGTALSLPISGTTSANWATSVFPTIMNPDLNQLAVYPQVFPSTRTGVAGDNKIYQSYTATGTNDFYQPNTNSQNNLRGALNSNTVDLSTATTFNVADLRLVFQIQKWMERNARAGNRYTSFLHSHFGVSPRDERLQRPEYIGGSKAPIIISEVLQTSQTGTTPQGNLAGHGVTATNNYAGKYHVKEFGLIMGIMSIMPRSQYRDGINRQWLRRTKYDFYFPEFAHLSEQAITNVEICAHDGADAQNLQIFGYQGKYNEMRTKHNMTCNGLRTTFDYWHLGREFNPASPPALNETFITCVPRKNIFADTASPGLIVSFGNLITAHRPMPVMSEPGLIDHN